MRAIDENYTKQDRRIFCLSILFIFFVRNNLYIQCDKYAKIKLRKQERRNIMTENIHRNDMAEQAYSDNMDYVRWQMAREDARQGVIAKIVYLYRSAKICREYSLADEERS